MNFLKQTDHKNCAVVASFSPYLTPTLISCLEFGKSWLQYVRAGKQAPFKMVKMITKHDFMKSSCNFFSFLQWLPSFLILSSIVLLCQLIGLWKKGVAVLCRLFFYNFSSCKMPNFSGYSFHPSIFYASFSLRETTNLLVFTARNRTFRIGMRSSPESYQIS